MVHELQKFKRTENSAKNLMNLKNESLYIFVVFIKVEF